MPHRTGGDELQDAVLVRPNEAGNTRRADAVRRVQVPVLNPRHHRQALRIGIVIVELDGHCPPQSHPWIVVKPLEHGVLVIDQALHHARIEPGSQDEHPLPLSSENPPNFVFREQGGLEMLVLESRGAG